MLRRPLTLVALFVFTATLSAGTKVPANTILIQGATAGASDPLTALPEGGSIADGAYANRYFGMSYPLPAGWIEEHKGPPPSDSGGYVLSLLTPSAGEEKTAGSGSILITAQDLFFSHVPERDELATVRRDRRMLQPYYSVEQEPAATEIGGRPFARFGYQSPDAGLHWQVLVTRIRCHLVQFVFTSRDTALIAKLAAQVAEAKLPANGDASEPVCIQDYATRDRIVSRTDPVLEERRFNPVPVRIIIDREGKVRHVHVISGFPEQTRKITAALLAWRFKPYLRDGEPAEVETGILFGAGAGGQVATADQ